MKSPWNYDFCCLNSVKSQSYGGFLKWRYPQIIQNWTSLILKPMVLGIPHLRNPNIYPTKHHFPAVPRCHVKRLDARRVVVLKLRSGTLQQVELVDVQIQRPGPDKRKTNETKGWSAERSSVRKRIDINIYI